LEDRAPKTKSYQTRESFIVLKTEDSLEKYKYYIIKGQRRYIKFKMESLPNYKKIKEYESIPNATNMLNRLKEKLKRELDFNGNKINLININHDQFLKRLQEIYNDKNIIQIL
jgi:hypothetical protein